MDRLRNVYEDVLGREHVGEHESFFALGGSSLLVVLLLERLREELGVRVGLQTFFDAPTLAGLREAVKGARACDLVALIERAAAAGPPERAAIAAPDGVLSYSEITALVGAAATSPTSASPAALRVPSTLAGARELLAALAARRPVVVLPASTRRVEEEQALRAFTAETQEGVYAFLTSGSTGRPKVVLAAYDRLYGHQLTQAEALAIGPQDTVLLTAPLAYSYGVRAGLLVGLLAGATVVLPPAPLDPRSLRDCLERHRVTLTLGVGVAYRLLLACGGPLPALRTALFGGEALPGDLAATWRQRTGVSLMEGFGCTETDTVAWNVDLVPGSVGRPLPGAEVRVRGEDGAPARHGVGELLVQTPDLACGYAGEPEVTDRCFAHGWYRTGDLGELRGDGHIRLGGRLDDRLNVAGLKVDPREVEAACREAVGLRDCAVVGVSGANGIVEVCAYVVADRPVRRADLVRALADRLSPHKIPTRVVQLDALPRTAAGKLRAADLRR